MAACGPPHCQAGEASSQSRMRQPLLLPVHSWRKRMRCRQWPPWLCPLPCSRPHGRLKRAKRSEASRVSFVT
jgi:hypothetical protein